MHSVCSILLRTWHQYSGRIFISRFPLSWCLWFWCHVMAMPIWNISFKVFFPVELFVCFVVAAVFGRVWELNMWCSLSVKTSGSGFFSIRGWGFVIGSISLIFISLSKFSIKDSDSGLMDYIPRSFFLIIKSIGFKLFITLPYNPLNFHKISFDQMWCFSSF